MIQSEEFQRREWQAALDDLVRSILRQPQAMDSEEREEIFEAWRERMELRFGIGHPTAIGRPPLPNIVRDEKDFLLIEGRLEEILGLARNLKGLLLAGRIQDETRSTTTRRRPTARRTERAPIRLLNRYEAQGFADALKTPAKDRENQENALLHATASLEQTHLQQSLSHQRLSKRKRGIYGM